MGRCPSQLGRLPGPGQEGLEHLRYTEDDMFVGEDDGLGI